MSLSGAFGGAEITEIRPGILAVHVEDCEVVDAWFLETLLSSLAVRWALVHGLSISDVDLDVRGA
ncbi:hypothetical protein [Cryobacterium sp. TMT1-66-1]|uniref:hypothetical protein n=1 Tax=Cryobacterium sp. TMT1-66-1 TaxID=1259242 RepID=UPI00106DB517|nr:hypothetical protein [Cryobacterium sp. TMT1-66-1]TFD04133.1 hypothetical protein E3T29_15885 [Cryobacterium sp. TMT1-66-1]